MSLYLGETLISGVTTPIEPTRNIGQIIQSITPLTDAGLHLLDGALIQGDGIYSDFVTYMATLSESHPECFTTEVNWQSVVSSKGACGKFVYTAASGNTAATIRLPKITGFIEGTIDSSALGELVDAGLPNITGSFNIAGYSDNTTSLINSATGVITQGALINTDSGCNFTGTSGKRYEYDLNASNSNAIYGNSSTVQPQAIKVYYYIVMSTTTKTNIEVDIDEVVTDLNSKADDSDVVHKSGDETITGQKTLKNTQATIANPPNNVSWRFTDYRDNNNVRIGVIGSQINPDGWHGTYLQAGDEGNIHIITNGTDVITYAPASDAIDSIVTTVGIFRATSESQDNYVKLGNGVLIQWGHVKQNTQQINVTFPVPFYDDGYRMFIQDAGQLSGYSYAGVTGITRTTTGATLYSYYANRYYDWLAIGFWY